MFQTSNPHPHVHGVMTVMADSKVIVPITMIGARLPWQISNNLRARINLASEAGSWKPDCKPEAGNQRPEARGQKPEARARGQSWKPDRKRKKKKKLQWFIINFWDQILRYSKVLSGQVSGMIILFKMFIWPARYLAWHLAGHLARYSTVYSTVS